MTVLNCLHLTDLHRGQDWYSDCIYPNVEEVLVEDLKRVHEYTGDWDLVLFTGDLVQSGGGHKGDEFRLLDDTLRALWDEFGKLGSLPQLLTVPGNHDLVWPDPRRAAVKLLRRWD
jgi:3',5'-cyclic AMP phosphodiesterase CpdA